MSGRGRSGPYKKISTLFARPVYGPYEGTAVLETLNSGQLTKGPNVSQFEWDFAEFVGGGEAVAVSSCMAALHLAWLGLGIGAGDRVIVPALTHPATALAVEMAGATPVFADVGPDGNIRGEDIAPLIDEDTRAVCVVHYLGKPCDMAGVRAVTRPDKLKIVEDCALAPGAFYDGQHVGLLGDVGCFSFYPAKHIATGEGGMLLTKHLELAKDARRRRTFGYDDWLQDFVCLGTNYRMTEMQAALGIKQLKRLPMFLKRRAENYGMLRDILAHKGFEVIDSASGSHYALTVLVPDGFNRDKTIKRMRIAGIEPSIYYRPIVPLTAYYSTRNGYEAGNWPNAERIANQSMCLPVGPHLDTGDMRNIGHAFTEACRT